MVVPTSKRQSKPIYTKLKYYYPCTQITIIANHNLCIYIYIHLAFAANGKDVVFGLNGQESNNNNKKIFNGCILCQSYSKYITITFCFSLNSF